MRRSRDGWILRCLRAKGLAGCGAGRGCWSPRAHLLSTLTTHIPYPTQVYDGPPQGLEDVALGVDADELSMRLGMDDADLAYTNQQPVALGLIKVRWGR